MVRLQRARPVQTDQQHRKVVRHLLINVQVKRNFSAKKSGFLKSSLTWSVKCVIDSTDIRYLMRLHRKLAAHNAKTFKVKFPQIVVLFALVWFTCARSIFTHNHMLNIKNKN